MRLKGHYLLLMMMMSVGPSLESFAQEYPFIQYSPKDGLINSRIRNVFQDSKGRMFFLTANGLSMYDGARFNNYGPEDGLGNPVVNDMLEITSDSILVATNTTELNVWVRGRIKKIIPTDSYCPVINKFIRTKDGMIYVATDAGVFHYNNRRFLKIDIENKLDNDTLLSFDDIQEVGKYLLVKVNYDMTHTHGLYLLDRSKKKILPFIDEAFTTIIQIPEFDLLLCCGAQLKSYSLAAAAAGKVKSIPIPAIYRPFLNLKQNSLVIDKKGNVFSIKLNSILKIPRDGVPILFDKTTGLDVNNINGVFIDKENIMWVQTDGSGLIKLANNNVEIVTGLFSKSATGISAIYADLHSDTTWLFNYEDYTIYSSTLKETIAHTIQPRITADHMLREGDHFYLFKDGKIYLAKPNGKNSYSTQLFYQFEKGSISNINRTILNNHYLYMPGPELTVIKDSKLLFKTPVSYTDQVAIDKKQRLWTAPRAGDLLCYSIHPLQPEKFLEVECSFKSQLPANFAPRSIAIDNDNRIWVGTRYEGLYCFEIKGAKIINQRHITVKEGLTDNFVYYLACDQDNNIWVGTQSGLDKVSMENGQFIVEGITRNNNIFQLIQAIAIAKNNQVWTFGNFGSIIRITNNPVSKEFQPQLQISQVRAGDTVIDMPASGLTVSHLQNNITVEVAAPSFIDEKQIMFSYLLEGSDNKHWSTPSRQATLNFINLPHGRYNLKIKASFPISSYQPREIAYAFTITPPWWDTWWSQLLMAATFVAMIVLAIRFYYQRKLQKQKILFEKQQAVEQERTRIAMEMHDDLGSGLTTIRYLAGGLSLQSGNSSKDKAEKIVSSAKSLVDNMNDIIWTMKSDNNSLSEALAYIRKQAAEQLETAGIDYHIDFPKNLPAIKLSNELKRNLLLISKEAVHNIVKHARATNVSLSAEWEAGKLRLWIADNGKGIDLPNLSTFGNGIKSMKKRAEEIKALLEVMNSEGTTIIITAPI